MPFLAGVHASLRTRLQRRMTVKISSYAHRQIVNFQSAYSPAMKTLRRFLADETAATAIEYGLIAAGISLAIIAIVNGLGTKLSTKFTAINSSLK